MSYKTISVYGLGYIGLPTAAMFASKDKFVVGVDVNEDVVKTINAGDTHIAEPDLAEIINRVVDAGFLRATTSPEPADVFIIAVPTPFLPVANQNATPQPDVSHIKTAAKSIASVLKRGDLVILESTSPTGTTEQMAAWLAEQRTDLTFPQTHGEESDVRISYCPERVLPGHVVRELVMNNRVIGGMTNRCSQAAIEVYRTFVEGDCSVTHARTAELVKLTENSFRDVGIAFANELSIICDSMNIDVWELISIANLHPRVSILNPGPGVGGHCIAVDPWFIVSSAPDKAKLIKAARDVNDNKPLWIIDKVKIAMADFLKSHPHKRINEVNVACFGLSYKPDVGDLRESPSLSIIQSISIFHEGPVFAIEPNINELPDNLKNIELVTFDVAVAEADIALLLVDHKEFVDRGRPDIDTILDLKGIWS